MIEEFDTLMNYVISWAEAKDLIKKENATKQMLKVIEEVGETAGALAKGKEVAIKDGIGDSAEPFVLPVDADLTCCLRFWVSVALVVFTTS